VLYQVLRYDPKAFKQRRSDGAWKLGDVRRVLYRLPEIMESGKRAVFWVEGEKDADALRRLGFVATTCSGGVKGFHHEMIECLRDRTVIILPDNDQAGVELAWVVKSNLARSIIVRVPVDSHKSDVSDWIAAGATKDTIIEAVKAQAWANCLGDVAIFNSLGGKATLDNDVHH
jgi:putative DNA primase/helicase